MDPITGSLLMSLGGGLTSSLGDKMGEWLGLTPDASSSPGMQGSIAGLNAAINASAPLTQQSMYNAAGQVGPQVRQGFENALGSLQQSAGAIQRSNYLQSLADRSLSNASTQTALSQRLAGNQMGALRRDALNTLRAGGAGPAAISAALSNLGSGSQQGAAQLLSQAAQANAQGVAQAGGLTGQAQGMLANDLNLRNQIYVDPYKAQVNMGTAGLAGRLAETGGQSATEARTNPLAGLAMGLGQAGGGMMTEWLSQYPGQARSDVTVGQRPIFNPASGAPQY